MNMLQKMVAKALGKNIPLTGSEIAARVGAKEAMMAAAARGTLREAGEEVGAIRGFVGKLLNRNVRKEGLGPEARKLAGDFKIKNDGGPVSAIPSNDKAHYGPRISSRDRGEGTRWVNDARSKYKFDTLDEATRKYHAGSGAATGGGKTTPSPSGGSVGSASTTGGGSAINETADPTIGRFQNEMMGDYGTSLLRYAGGGMVAGGLFSDRGDTIGGSIRGGIMGGMLGGGKAFVSAFNRAGGIKDIALGAQASLGMKWGLAGLKGGTLHDLGYLASGSAKHIGGYLKDAKGANTIPGLSMRSKNWLNKQGQKAYNASNSAFRGVKQSVFDEMI